MHHARTGLISRTHALVVSFVGSNWMQVYITAFIDKASLMKLERNPPIDPRIQDYWFEKDFGMA